MAERVISTRIAIKGESEYREKISGINDSLKTLRSDLAKTESDIRTNGETIELLGKKNEQLSALYDQQTKKIAELRDAIANAQKSEADWSEKVEESRTKLEASREALERFKSSGLVAEETERKLTEEVAQCERELEANEAGLAAAERGINAWQRQINAAEIELNNINKDLETNTGKMEESSDKTGGLSDAFSLLAANLASVGIEGLVREIADALKDLVVEMQAAEQTVVRMTGATGDALAEMSEIAERVYGNSYVMSSMSEAAAVIGGLNTRLGLTGEELEKAATLMDTFAMETGENAAGSVRGIAQLMNSWNIEVADMEGLLDKLTVAAQNSGIGISELTSGLTTNRGALAEIGFSLDESIGLFAELERVGIPATQFISSLRKAIKEATDAGIPAGEALDDAMNRIANATDNVEALSIAEEFFGQRAAPTMVNAIQDGRFELGAWVDILEGADGVMQDTAEASVTLTDELNRLGNMIKSVFSERLKPALDLIMDMIDEVDTLMDRIESRFPGAARSIETLGQKIDLTIAASEAGVSPLVALANVVGRLANAGQSAEESIDEVGEEAESASERVQGLANTTSDLVDVAAEASDANDELAGTEDRVTDAAENSADALDKDTESKKKNKTATKDLNDVLEDSEKKFASLEKTLKNAQTTYQNAVDSAAKTVQSAQEKLLRAQESVDSAIEKLNDAYVKAYEQKREALDKAVDDAQKALKKAQENVVKAGDKVKAAYDKAHDAAKKSISGQIGLFKEWSNEITVDTRKAEQLVELWYQNAEAIRRYGENVAFLKSSGLDQGIIDQVSSDPAQTAGLVRDIRAQASTVDELNAAWARMNEEIDATASLLEDADLSSELDGLREAEEEAQAAAEELRAAQEAAAQEIVVDYEDVKSQVQAVESAYASLADAQADLAEAHASAQKKIGEAQEKYNETVAETKGKIKEVEAEVDEATSAASAAYAQTGLALRRSADTATESTKLMSYSIEDSASRSASAMGAVHESIRLTAEELVALDLAKMQEFAIACEQAQRAAERLHGDLFLLQAVVDNCREFIDVFKELADTVAEVQKRVSRDMKTLSENVETAAEGARAVAEKAAKSVADTAKDKGEKIVKTTKSAMDDVKRAIDSKAGDIANAAADAAYEAVSAYKKQLADIYDATLEVFRETGELIEGMSNPMFEDGKTLGKNFVNGMIQGLDDRDDYLYRAMQQVVDNAITSARYAAAVASPSKKTTEIFENVGEGMVVGLEHKREKIDATVQDVVNDALRIDIPRMDFSPVFQLAAAAPRDSSGEKIDRRLERMERTLDGILGAAKRKKDVYLDSGVIVGVMSDAVDARLGTRV